MGHSLWGRYLRYSGRNMRWRMLILGSSGHRTHLETEDPAQSKDCLMAV
jgi:hypothetical protein